MGTYFPDFPSEAEVICWVLIVAIVLFLLGIWLGYAIGTP